MGIQLWIYRSTIWIKMLIDFLLFWSQFQRLCTWQLSMGKKISWGSWWGDLSTSTSFQVPNSFWILNEVCYNFGKNIIHTFIHIRHVPPSVKSEMPSVAAVSLVRLFQNHQFSHWLVPMMFNDSSTSTSTSSSASTSTTSYIQSFYQKVRELAAEAGLTPLHLAAYSGVKKTHHFFHIISVNLFATINSIYPSRPNHPFSSAQSSDSIMCRKCYSTSAIATWFMPLSLIVGEYQWPIYQHMITHTSPTPFPLLQ